jgi:hypothetical protein
VLPSTAGLLRRRPSHPVLFLPRSAVAGIFVALLGIAIFQPTDTSAILGATPKDRSGAGSAIVGEARTVGQSVAIATAAAVLPEAAVLGALLSLRSSR